MNCDTKMTKANAIAMTRLSHCPYRDVSIPYSKEHHDKAIAFSYDTLMKVTIKRLISKNK
ncbi:MAG: hypothetical protein ACRCZS_18415 [Chroococcidiopsis sp.]